MVSRRSGKSHSTNQQTLDEITWDLVAIDPGERAGIAYFHGGELLLAEAPQASRPMQEPREKVKQAVLEVPFKYPRDNIDPNRLITLAVTAGRLLGRFEAKGVLFVHPRQWKGQRPKNVDIRYTYKLLSPNEQKVVDKATTLKTERHNVLDAVGIGLWKLGRR